MVGDQQRKNKIPKILPPSDDEKFWDKAEIIKAKIKKVKPKCSKFVQRGSVVVCISCPNPHVVPNAYLNKEGKLKKLDKKKIL